jgi:hypothetical protein
VGTEPALVAGARAQMERHGRLLERLTAMREGAARPVERRPATSASRSVHQEDLSMIPENQ